MRDAHIGEFDRSVGDPALPRFAMLAKPVPRRGSDARRSAGLYLLAQDVGVPAVVS